MPTKFATAPFSSLFLLSGFSGYGYGHGGMGIIGTALVVLLVPFLLGRI
jgi:Protein of unknown function (DUF3309)